MKKLEEFGYLGSVYFQSYRKYLYLTDKGLDEAGLNGSWSINKDIIWHDIIAVNVFQYFLKRPEVYSGNIYLDYAGVDVRPDSAVNLKSTPVKRVALEVELTQKSFNRVEDKFNYYISDSCGYDLVVYIFQKTATFEAYKRTIDRIDRSKDPVVTKRCKDNIALVLEPEIKHRVFTLSDSPTYFEGKMTTLKNILQEMTQ